MATGIPARLTPAEGRKFGLTVGVAFWVLTALMWWREHAVAMYVFGGLGATLIASGLVIPGRLGPVYRGWMGVAHAISKVTTPIFMGIVFFVVMMPVGLIMRGLGRNPVRHEPDGDSYWAVRGDERGTLHNQF